MDPNANGPVNPGATPPAPPEWGAAPQQPAPPAWGAPAPTAPPAWGVAAPTTSGSGIGSAVGSAGKNIVLRIVATLVVVGLIAGGIAVYKFVVNPDQLGQVIFTTQDQASASAATNCKIPSQVKSVKLGTAVWSVYQFKHRVNADQTIHEEDFRNGVKIYEQDIPGKDAVGYDCLGIMDDLSGQFTSAGDYEIKLTIGTEVLADGKLTVTP